MGKYKSWKTKKEVYQGEKSQIGIGRFSMVLLLFQEEKELT